MGRERGIAVPEYTLRTHYSNHISRATCDVPDLEPCIVFLPAFLTFLTFLSFPSFLSLTFLFNSVAVVATPWCVIKMALIRRHVP